MEHVPGSLKIGDESLEACLKSIRLAVNKLWDPPLLNHYTRHGLDHSERIIEILDSILAQNIILSEKERFILQAAAYLHDIGMQSPKYAGLPEKEDYTIEDKELIRGKHNKSSAKMINDSVSQNPPFSLGLIAAKKTHIILQLSPNIIEILILMN